MSMLLIMESIDSGKIKYEDTVPITPNATSFGGSQLWLDVRESNKFTVNEMLKGIAIHSANDATVAMAEMIAGSESAFVKLMNEKAKALGMNDTNFLDCTGLTDDGHYSSANDIAVISRELIQKHPKILEYTSIRRDKFGEGKRAKPTDLDNTNQLIGRYEGMVGLKTGSTSKAGQNLSAVAKRNNMMLIAVVLGEADSSTRFAEIQKLLDYGFANFEVTQVNKKGDEAGAVEVKKGMQTTVKAIYGSDVNLLMKKGEKGKIVREPRFDSNITAPAEEGKKVGQMVYFMDGKEIGKTDIVLETKVEKASAFRLFFRMIVQWFGLGRK
jgi:D-alanyl-D-alanine carboxypeptidase (penicillin-binding protein 5/6)